MVLLLFLIQNKNKQEREKTWINCSEVVCKLSKLLNQFTANWTIAVMILFIFCKALMWCNISMHIINFLRRKGSLWIKNKDKLVTIIFLYMCTYVHVKCARERHFHLNLIYLISWDLCILRDFNLHVFFPRWNKKFITMALSITYHKTTFFSVDHSIRLSNITFQHAPNKKK